MQIYYEPNNVFLRCAPVSLILRGFSAYNKGIKKLCEGYMSEKIDNILNLALESDNEELQKSEELSVGFDEETRRWDLIIRYTGDIKFLDKFEEISVVNLMGGYAVVNVPEALVERLAAEEQIIFVEKPKSLYFTVINGARVSCIDEVQNVEGLYGEGVIVGIIDSGIDYANSVFRNNDGTTRILELWDQSLATGNKPVGYDRGSVFTREDINRALKETNEQERYRIVPSRDLSGHGTHVAGIAAGNFAMDKNNNLGVATKSEILVVKLAAPREGSFPRTIELLEAIDFVAKRALFYGMPLALNLSFGNTYGSHDGTSLVETFINYVSDMERISIAVGTGNEGAAAGHTGGYVIEEESKNVELTVSEYERTMSIQIWKSYADTFEIEVISPSGESTGILAEVNEATRYYLRGSNTMLLVYYGTPKPYSPYQEIYIDFIPDNSYIEQGLWIIRITGVKTVTGRYDMWLPTAAALGTSTGFTRPTPEITLTIPSTADKVISVGAYDSATDRYAEFSGRGYTRQTNQIKPDIVAPGVDIRSAAVGGGLTVLSGTSMATPFVTGSLALMMEWGIVKGNDRFLYGEKAKAYLIRGARKLPGIEDYPDSRIGFGALCLEESLPR